MPLPELLPDLERLNSLYRRSLAKDPHELIKTQLFPVLQQSKFSEVAQHARRLLEKDFESTGRFDLCQLSTFTLMMLIIYFHGQRTRCGAHQNKSVSAIKTYVEQAAITSGRQVTNLISRLVDTHLVVREHSPFDNRIQWLVPTNEMIKTIINQILCTFEPLTELGIASEDVTRLKEDQSFQETYLYEFCNLWISGCDYITPFTIIRRMMTKSKGLPLINSLAKTTVDSHGELFAEKPIPFNVGLLAETHRVSRSHMRLLLDDLHKEGYLRLSYPRHELIVSEDLATAIQCSLASIFIMHKTVLPLAIANHGL